MTNEEFHDALYRERCRREAVESENRRLRETQDLFKNAARIHTDFAVARYLIANADGRQDGAEKAQRHIELCAFYVAAVRGSDPDRAIMDYREDFWAVHEATQELTSYLDDQIGFPLTGQPDYDRLAPLFFERFHALAMAALKPYVKV